MADFSEWLIIKAVKKILNVKVHKNDILPCIIASPGCNSLG